MNEWVAHFDMLFCCLGASMPKYTEKGSMARLYVALPKETLDAIDEYILRAGFYRSYFFHFALIVGARLLMGLPAGQESVDEVISNELARLPKSLVHESVNRKPGEAGDGWKYEDWVNEASLGGTKGAKAQKVKQSNG